MREQDKGRVWVAEDSVELVTLPYEPVRVKLHRYSATLRGLVPTFLVTVAVLVVELTATLPWWQWVGLLVVELAAMLAGVRYGTSYRPLTDAERARLRESGLVHYTRVDPELLRDGDGGLRLEKRFNHWWSMAWRSDRPWRRPVRAVYFFIGDSTHGGIRTNILKPQTVTAVVTIPGATVVDQLLIRKDGCVALVGDYTGPGDMRRVRIVREGRRRR